MDLADIGPTALLDRAIANRFRSREGPQFRLHLDVTDKSLWSSAPPPDELSVTARHHDIVLLGRVAATAALDALDPALLPSIRRHLSDAARWFFPIFDAATAYGELERIVWCHCDDDEEREAEVRHDLAQHLKCAEKDVPADQLAKAFAELPYRRNVVEPLFHPIDRYAAQPIPLATLRACYPDHVLITPLLDAIDDAARHSRRLAALQRRRNDEDPHETASVPEWFMLWHRDIDGPGPVADIVADIYDEHTTFERETGFAPNWHTTIRLGSKADVRHVWNALDTLRALHDAIARFFAVFTGFKET